MLSKNLKVEYNGKDNLLVISPVFDIVNLPLQVEGRLAGQKGIAISTFFLVYKDNKEKKLMWISSEDCDLVKE